MKNFMVKSVAALSVVALIAIALGLSGCAQAPKEWSAGNGEIKIVASTNIWASISVEALGKDVATAHALIYNINQDPHSFEASARDQLVINQADIVVMNGGGYDDFMTTLVAAAENKPTLINAVDIVGTRDDGNEHVWLDIDRVRAFGETLSAQVVADYPDLTEKLAANLATFNANIDDLAADQAELKAKANGAQVIQTEALVTYLLEDTGFVDATPTEMSEAVEEERDIPPLAMQQVQQLIDAGKISAILSPFGGYDSSSPEWTGNVATLGFYEILSMDPDTYEQYDKSYFDYVNSCIRTLEVGLE
ncbi:metal ABC transporter solute-binding protein, Zn/Mn family [Rhodoluna limnophila]|uniref:metal ABC transporter solute-binding protein, Zn/Mn family n=1 Tax=Rhodoluna limnophila TaxID=232537 RepID=UPI001105844B|nr:zinc ABC transporter substrate-binding protein [Rhodoluna limnophila]